MSHNKEFSNIELFLNEPPRKLQNDTGISLNFINLQEQASFVCKSALKLENLNFIGLGWSHLKIQPFNLKKRGNPQTLQYHIPYTKGFPGATSAGKEKQSVSKEIKIIISEDTPVRKLQFKGRLW